MAQATSLVAFPGKDETPEQKLLSRLNDPNTVDALNRLLDHVDLLAVGVSMIDEFLRRGDVIADSVSDSVGDLRKLAEGSLKGIDLAELKQVAGELPKLVETGTGLVKDGFFAPETVKPLAELGTAAAASYTAAKNAPAPAKPYGIFDLLGLLKDPDVQRALHLGVNVAKQFGQRVK